MPRFKAPEDRLSEYIGLRLTVDEKELAEHLAALEGTTLTELIRELLRQKAEEWGLVDGPKKSASRRPGRPRNRHR